MPRTSFLHFDCQPRMPDCADSDLLLARHGVVACDSRANLHDSTSLACIANHVADACVKVRVSALHDAFDISSQKVFFAARFDVGQLRDMLVVAR